MATMRSRLLSFCRAVLLVALFWGGTPAFGEPTLTLGILGFRPAAEEQMRWQPLIDYLNAQIHGARLTAKVLGYNDLEAAIAAQAVDFVLTNPGHYVLMTHRNGLSSPLATLVPVEQGQALAKFGGVVFTAAERKNIQSLQDLRGQRIAITSTGSLGGYQAQAMALLQQGIRLPEDASLIKTDMPHDRVVTAVLSGQADAGFVRSGVLEAMAAEGKLDLKQIRVLGKRGVPGFPFALSTELYPEWTFAAMPTANGDIARQVTAALLGLPHDGPLAKHLGIKGFDIPADYEQVRATLEALRLPPYSEAPRFTLTDIWNRYRSQTITAALLITLIVILGLWLSVLNRRLTSAQQRAERQALEWRNFLTALGEGVFGVDREGRCTFINPTALALLEMAQADVLGRSIHALIHAASPKPPLPGSQSCPVLMTLADGKTRNAEDNFITKSGNLLPVALTATSLNSDGELHGVVVVFHDISARKRLEASLREEAATDPLTGLPNRRYFLAEIERHWARIARGEQPMDALMMLDLDHFKNINDTHGHTAGDEVLKHLGRLMPNLLRRGDLIGRLGGEEFAILQVNTTPHEAMRMAERIREYIASAHAHIGTEQIRYTVSIGVTLIVPADASARAALKRADAALYRAKGAGRNRVEWEDPPAEHLPVEDPSHQD